VSRSELVRLAFPLTLLNVGLAFQTAVDRLTLAALGHGQVAVGAHGAALAAAAPSFRCSRASARPRW
jgi:hypothetical protein